MHASRLGEDDVKTLKQLNFQAREAEQGSWGRGRGGEAGRAAACAALRSCSPTGWAALPPFPLPLQTGDFLSVAIY